MKEKYIKVISNILKVKPIEINSNLVSAQNRNRLYWTNIIENIKQPKDKNIKLESIVEKNINNILTEEYIEKRKKIKRWGNHFGTIQNYKSNTLVAIGKSDVLLLTDLKRFLLPIECERLQTIPDNYTNIVSNSHRYRLIGNSWTVDIIAYIFSFMKKRLNRAFFNL
jgi:site-specific DNA-cytosine methylase